MSEIKTKIKLEKIKIQNYASIGEEGVEISFPKDKPVILFGSNNAGKTNILSGIQSFWDIYGRQSKLPERPSGENDSEIANAAQISNELTADTKITLYYKDPEHHEDKMAELEYDPRQKKFVNRHPDMNVNILISSTFIGTDYGNTLSELRNILKSGSTLTPLGKRILSYLDRIRHFEGTNAVSSEKLLLPGKGELAFWGLVTKILSSDELLNDNEVNDALLLLDEPETHLHFVAQEGFMEIINDLCKEEGIQAIIATHSENFLCADDIEGFVRVYKENGITKVRQLTNDELFYTCHIRGEEDYKALPIGQHYWSVKLNTDQLKGFFADTILLVEGQTEYYALPIYLSRTFLSEYGVQIVACGSKSAIQTYWRLFTAYGYKCFVLYDHDTDEDKERAKDGKSDLNKELELFFDGRPQSGNGYSFCPTAAYFKKYWEDYFKNDLGSEYKGIKKDLEENYEISFAKDREKASRAKAIALQSKEIGHRDIPFVNDLKRQLEELDNVSQEDYAKYVETVKEGLKNLGNRKNKTKPDR